MGFTDTSQPAQRDTIPDVELSASNYRCILFPSIFMLFIAMICFTNMLPVAYSL